MKQQQLFQNFASPRSFPPRPPRRTSLIRPFNTREWTDLPCLVVYCVFTLIIFSAFFYSFILQKDRNALRPSDPDGRKCGDGNASAYPYIYFPAPFPDSVDQAVCVKKCPQSTNQQLECLPNSKVRSCKANSSKNSSNSFSIYPTTTYPMLSMCEPNSKIILYAISSRSWAYNLLVNFQQIYFEWKIILVVCPLITFFFVSLYVFLITRIKDLRIVFKISIIISVISMLAFSVYSFTNQANKIFSYMKFLGIFTFIIAAAIVFVFFFWRHYLQRSLALVNIGAEYIRDNRGLIFMSLTGFLLCIVILASESITLLFIYSINSQSPQTASDYKFAYFDYKSSSIFVTILLIFVVFHCIWTILILYSMGRYISIAAVTYWTLNIQYNWKNSLFTMFRFHLGSVVIGSLVNTLMSKITSLLYFFMPAKNGKVGCWKCQNFDNCYEKECFKKFFGGFSHLNYVVVAMKGQNLINSAQQISHIYIQQIRFVTKAYKLSKFLLFFTKMLVALATTLICFLIIELTAPGVDHFITNVTVFILSSFLTTFAFDSYDLSFQVMLIAMLLCPNQEYQINVKSQEGRDRVFSLIKKWFQEQKNYESRNKEELNQPIQ